MSVSVCVATAGKLVTLAAASFSLSWVHSVEKVEWRETWNATPSGLVLQEAAVKGSGAGMEPGEGAVLIDGWWIWRPSLPPQRNLVLAASGATVSAWTLCSGGACVELGGDSAEPIVIHACP